MEKKGMFTKEMISVIFLSSVAVSVAVRQYGACISETVEDCGWNSFKCLDETCIARAKYCDGSTDCPDNSDEAYCSDYSYRRRYGGHSLSSCPTSPRAFWRCSTEGKCIPLKWTCDGVIDCPSGEDEQNCGSSTDSALRTSTESARRKAVDWLLNTIVLASPTRKWGPLVHKTAVAFYLSDSDFLSDSSSVRKEITYELTIQFLSRLSQKTIQNISSSDLASFINSFLVTCTDPRDFHGFNLVEELRTRVEKQNYTNPYVLLALCNAGDTITESDVQKLTTVFMNDNRQLWTDTQAVALMALSCAGKQPDSGVGLETLSELALELKDHQYRNGTVENLLSTLLVMQALYSAESEEDPDNFDERKALSYILENQKSDGSFGNIFLTYYALPVLNCKSLVDISNSHCVTVPKDEDTAVFDLMNRVGPKVLIPYSVWIGKDRDIQRTLTLRVPVNTSFYGIMELAAEIDSKYKFEYVVKNRKPYINAVSGIMDDSESGQFWFPCILKDKTVTNTKKSTADIIPQADDHIVMWYKRGSWLE